jgi:HSP20 family protein
MAAVDPRTLMWAAACEMIDRAERLHRQFFQPTAAAIGELSWEPPIDIIETDSEILITVALPGVDRNAMKISAIPRGSRVHRLEIPYGKFERRIRVPAAQPQLDRSELANGCLTLKFSK